MILFVCVRRGQTQQTPQTPMICLWTVITYIALMILAMLKKEEFAFIIKKPQPFIFLLDQCTLSEITFTNKKKGHVISLYRSPSQTSDKFDSFLQLFEELLQDLFKFKSSFVLITGNFNYRNSNWYLEDPVRPHETCVKALTSFHGLHQLIKTPAHLLQNSATCIDLAFTNQPHLVMESGVYSSLSSTCHYEIIFARLNMKVEYPPPIPELTRLSIN